VSEKYEVISKRLERRSKAKPRALAYHEYNFHECVVGLIILINMKMTVVVQRKVRGRSTVQLPEEAD